MSPKAKARGKDWFDSLDKELEKRTQEIAQDMGEQATKKSELNAILIEDLFKVWKRFHRINVTFTLEPSYNTFAVFDDTFPYGDWHWRPGFNTMAVNEIQIIDRTQNQGRVGDALKLTYVTMDEKPHLKMSFEYCEGEHYYKYSGWKRIWSQHTLYEEEIDKINVDQIHSIMGDIVRVWYESHLKRNRDSLLQHLKKKYEHIETFSQ